MGNAKIYSTNDIDKIQSDMSLKLIQIENSAGTGSDLAEYMGVAAPGTADATAGWQIRKLSYDANDKLTDVQWADGNVAFDNVWNDRASLSYS